jgi:hypothetical protein
MFKYEMNPPCTWAHFGDKLMNLNRVTEIHKEDDYIVFLFNNDADTIINFDSEEECNEGWKVLVDALIHLKGSNV